MTLSPALSLPTQRRLRSVVKHLVIELAHLEYCLAAEGNHGAVVAAADHLDTAIDDLNALLEQTRQQQSVA